MLRLASLVLVVVFVLVPCLALPSSPFDHQVEPEYKALNSWADFRRLVSRGERGRRKGRGERERAEEGEESKIELR